MKSWKTTILGICAIVAAATTAITAMLDGDPATVPNWSALIAIASTGIAAIFARDNKVTSEQANAK